MSNAKSALGLCQAWVIPNAIECSAATRALQNLAENGARQGRAAAPRRPRSRPRGRNDSRAQRLNHVPRCAAVAQRDVPTWENATRQLWSECWNPR